LETDVACGSRLDLLRPLTTFFSCLLEIRIKEQKGSFVKDCSTLEKRETKQIKREQSRSLSRREKGERERESGSEERTRRERGREDDARN